MQEKCSAGPLVPQNEQGKTLGSMKICFLVNKKQLNRYFQTLDDRKKVSFINTYNARKLKAGEE